MYVLFLTGKIHISSKHKQISTLQMKKIVNVILFLICTTEYVVSIETIRLQRQMDMRVLFSSPFSN